MPQPRMDYPDAVWTKPQLIDQLSAISRMLHANALRRTGQSSPKSQARWLELIRAVSDLVRQAAIAGRRIDFTDEVCGWEPTRDITHLLDTMRQAAYVIRPIRPDQQDLTIINPAFNQLYGAGTGQFANGLLYRCAHKNERSFFIGRDRIYFYRHLMRAFFEAGHYLISLNGPT